MSLRDWICAYDLACPYLKYDQGKQCWIALNVDPCPTCNRVCQNKGKSFPKQDKLIIVKVSKA